MMNFKKSHIARIVEPQYISGRECEVDSSEGVGSYLVIYSGSDSRTRHFSEHGRLSTVRTEELEFYDSVLVIISTSPSCHYSPIPYYSTSREVHCWNYVLIVRKKGATIDASLWWEGGWLAPVRTWKKDNRPSSREGTSWNAYIPVRLTLSISTKDEGEQ